MEILERKEETWEGGMRWDATTVIDAEEDLGRVVDDILRMAQRTLGHAHEYPFFLVFGEAR
jgi:hypothetical protein